MKSLNRFSYKQDVIGLCLKLKVLFPHGLEPLVYGLFFLVAKMKCQNDFAFEKNNHGRNQFSQTLYENKTTMTLFNENYISRSSLYNRRRCRHVHYWKQLVTYTILLIACSCGLVLSVYIILPELKAYVRHMIYKNIRLACFKLIIII